MNMHRVFATIWEFLVKEEYLKDFRRVYGPEGEWVQLFRKGEGYFATDLYQDISNPNRFVSVDFWRSEADRDRFRQEFTDEFDQLDKDCERFTERETLVGEFYTTSLRF